MVDFWAPWCGHCRLLAPAVKRLGEQYEGRIKIAKVDIDDHPDLSRKYNVKAIPTLVLFKDGKPVSSVLNPRSEEAIESWLRESGAL